jgi:hypothetical protein
MIGLRVDIIWQRDTQSAIWSRSVALNGKRIDARFYVVLSILGLGWMDATATEIVAGLGACPPIKRRPMLPSVALSHNRLQ